MDNNFLVQQYRHLYWVLLMISFDHSLLFQKCRICCKINYCTSYQKAITLFLLPLPNMTKGRVIISLHHCSTSAEYCSKFLPLCFGFLYNEKIVLWNCQKVTCHSLVFLCKTFPGFLSWHMSKPSYRGFSQFRPHCHSFVSEVFDTTFSDTDTILIPCRYEYWIPIRYWYFSVINFW